MLQQMSSPSAQVGEVTSFVRTLDGRVCGELSSGGSSDVAEDNDLPECKVKRNYNCSKCTFYTQNPRAYLFHVRDVHFEKLKIFDCPHCVYASRHYQKLVRHITMVHMVPTSATNGDTGRMSMNSPDPIENMIEGVEEGADVDIQNEMEDENEESMELLADVDIDGDKTADEQISSNVSKDKSKYFSCKKCSYVTHVRARFTKHVKYHSMPMIKCTVCDFRTPYKWNLDRHMKNHGGTGSFHCSMCNFTADIKQSLTVHEMNHHTMPVNKLSCSRRRNRVGASDLEAALARAAARAAAGADDNSLITKEDEESGDSQSSNSATDMDNHSADIELVTCNSESNDALAYDDIAKTEQQLSPSDDTKHNKQNRKIPRPIPQLIPLTSSTPNQVKTPPNEPPPKKFKENNAGSNELITSKFKNLPSDITLIPTNNTPKDTMIRKNNFSTFFDRLKERLLTETGEEGSLVCKSCGFASKCLSEHSVHEKSCTPQTNKVTTNPSHSNLSSTRCQNCRHRCKSSADLYIHLKTCSKPNKKESENIVETKEEDINLKQDREIAPHPMENIVFVWNDINQDSNKFNTPLDININDDSTLPEINKNLELEVVDDNDGMNLSPSNAMGKKVFKCSHCPFWASTASRFHVHIVGHLNKKPFECSICKYKSNWRWDITKHIKLKSARDPEHNDAKVLMTDETGRRNYSKYTKFLAVIVTNENGENEFHYVDPVASTDGMMEVDESFNDGNDSQNSTIETQPLNLRTQNDQKYLIGDVRIDDSKKPKKTLWKCKKCNYKDPSKEALLEHVREHSKEETNQDGKKVENIQDPSDLAYRCGHCNQLSNWKHVIQRHCRLKHEGIIKVITTVKSKQDSVQGLLNETNSDTCPKCPFKTDDKKILSTHMQQHQPSPQLILRCCFCPFFAKNEHELMQHLVLHGITDPDEYLSKAVECTSPLPDQQGTTIGQNSNKRHKCTDCPYETNSKSQYMYHEQFHRLPADTPYKCPECNYSVSKRHLLHQHMRVHGIITKKNDTDPDLEGMSSFIHNEDIKSEPSVNLDEIPYVWVSAKNEFHKMYKCRYCSYVNSQECKIPTHEKIHFIVFENSQITIYKCLECKSTYDSAAKLAEHSKTHGEIYGRIYCSVDLDIPDADQIEKLRKAIENEKSNGLDDMLKVDGITQDEERIKTLYFCHKCPARYFSGGELKVHDRFHDLLFENKCSNCDFSVPLESDLVAHNTVHSDEYMTKTKMLKFMHNIHPSHEAPRLQFIHCQTTSQIIWVTSNPNNNYDNKEIINRKSDKHVPKQYLCKECPAKFFKSSALNYHSNLHGGEGDHKCKKCSYTVKNIGNLAKHELLHENESKRSTCDYDSGDDMDFKNIPLSGTDLFQRKTEAQKRVHTEKDKFVKPNDHFPPVLQADPQFGYLMHGNPEFIYPTYLKNGRQKEKRYKCHKCPSAFEKREQYKIHLSLHGSKQRYKCEICDYSVKYYANYVQHMRKHQMNDEAQAERKKGSNEETEYQENKVENCFDNIKLAIKTMPRGVPKSDFQQFSISDQQTLRLLQRRRSINSCALENNPSETSPVKDRKLHMCLLCPYTNQRQDALTNHYRRHDETDILNAGSHKCSYCDLVVVQSHFLREHLKTHFHYQKTLIPECFVANQDVSFSIKNVEEENICNDLKLDTHNKTFLKCNDDKIFVKINTGELVVE